MEVATQYRQKIGDVIRQYIGERSRYGRCSVNCMEARKEAQGDVEMRQKFIERLQSLA